LQTELDIPVIYVSHAIDEVARLADHLVLLEAGRVAAQGPTSRLLTRLDLPLAHGDSAAAVIAGTVLGHEPGFHLTQVGFPGGNLRFVSPARQRVRAPGETVRLRVQARDVSLTLSHQADTSILNVLPACVLELREDSPGYVMVVLDTIKRHTPVGARDPEVRRRPATGARHIRVRPGQGRGLAGLETAHGCLKPKRLKTACAGGASKARKKASAVCGAPMRTVTP
jgi:ABC-type molybdate transport system ATPase subunit